MKKVILTLITALAMFSCKEADKEKKESGSTASEAQKKTGIAAQAIAPCNGPLVVINKDVFTPAELTAWETTNGKYYCSLSLTATNSEMCKNYGVVDLSLISDKTSVVAEWLEDNRYNLCYPASYPMLEKDHRVVDLAIIKSIDQSITASKNLHMTLQQFVSKVPNFDVFFYDRYINFSIDAATEIPAHEPGNKFDGSLYSFSVPSIKAIASTYNIQTKDFDKFEVDLVKVKHTSGKVTVGFKISNGAVPLGYYDYSTDPTGNPPHTLRSSNNFR